MFDEVKAYKNGANFIVPIFWDNPVVSVNIDRFSKLFQRQIFKK